MKKKIEVVIQARMGSSRLPGKVMMNLCQKPVLWHILERVKQATWVDNIIVATSTLEADNAIANYLKSIGVTCFRGDESNVLSRYYNAVKQYPASAIVRITADCPLIDPFVIDRVISSFLDSSFEYATNVGEARNYPRGLDCEIFTCDLLERAFHEATEDYEKEHVTPFMYWKQDSILSIVNEKEYSNMRWTLDTIEDFQLIEAIYNHFYQSTHDFYMDDIYEFVVNNPPIFKINHNVMQKQIEPKSE
ncbi:MAG: glycosyltransferase family protein [Oscillospiraceae bacterium]